VRGLKFREFKPMFKSNPPHIFEKLNSLDLSPVLGANMQKFDFIKYVAYNFTGAFKPVDLETEVTLPFFSLKNRSA